MLSEGSGPGGRMCWMQCRRLKEQKSGAAGYKNKGVFAHRRIPVWLQKKEKGYKANTSIRKIRSCMSSVLFRSHSELQLLAAESKWELGWEELNPTATACGEGEQRAVEHTEHQQQMGFFAKHGTTVRLGRKNDGFPSQPQNIQEE